MYVIDLYKRKPKYPVLLCLLNLKQKKDINAVMHPITAPIIRDNIKIPTKSHKALKKALVSKPPLPDWYNSP